MMRSERLTARLARVISRYQPTPRARKEEVALNSLPQTTPEGAGSHRHIRSSGKLLRKNVFSKQASKVPVLPVRHLRLPLALRPTSHSLLRLAPRATRSGHSFRTCPSALGKLVFGGFMCRGQTGLVNPNKPSVDWKSGR